MNLKQKLYDWTSRPRTLVLLFLWAAAEGCFFFVPPDFALAPLVLMQPAGWARMAAACVCGSLVGSCLTWFLGQYAPETGMKLLENVALLKTSKLVYASNLVHHDRLLAFIIQPFALVPVKAFVFAAARSGLPLLAVLPAVAVGRALRNFGLAYLASFLGGRYRQQLNDYLLPFLTAWFCVGLILVFIVDFLI